jgi:ssRNA-specific RNase YbeY (16S rRNA maturation enzyme)
MWTNLLPHQKKGKKLKPTDVLAFPWESNTDVSDVSKEEKKRLAQEFWAKADAINK